MAWREENDGERIILREEDIDLGKRVAHRRVYVDKSDAADVWVDWGNDETNVVTLTAPDMDELCLWWAMKGRPDYRALVVDAGATLGFRANMWGIKTPDSFIELLHEREAE